LVSFLERFGDKQVYLLGGNHDSDASGRCALDFIREISDKPWTVVHGEVKTVNGICMIPYFRRSQFGVDTDAEVVGKVMAEIPSDTRVAVLHHAIAGTKTASGQMTDMFGEPVFDASTLLTMESRPRVLGAHIHFPQDKGRLQIIGSWMCQDVGETEDKRVLRWDSATDEMESIVLPGRKLLKLVDPDEETLKSLVGYYGLIKVVTDRPEIVPKGLAEAVQVHEKPKEARRTIYQVDDYSPEALIKVYAAARGLDLAKLERGWKLIAG
jgi:hypothetical protein